MSADVVGYSRRMGMEETSTLDALRAHRAELIDDKIDEHGGRIFKIMGDGLLLEFPSVVDATQCMVEIQSGMAELNQGVDEDQRITFLSPFRWDLKRNGLALTGGLCPEECCNFGFPALD